MSVRNSGSGIVPGRDIDTPGVPHDERTPTFVPARGNEDAILDATRDLVLTVGVRRTTATDVARRAGISRMTLYRRFRDVEALLVALLTREVGRLLQEVAAEVTALPTARERLVASVVSGVGWLADDQLLARLVEVDPEVLLPYLLERSGTSQRALRSYLDALLAAGVGDGSVRPLEPGVVSHVLQLVIQSFVVSARITHAESDAVAARAELGQLLDSYLRP